MGFFSSLREKVRSVTGTIKDKWQEIKEKGRKVIEHVSERIETWSERAEQKFREIKTAVVETVKEVKEEVKEFIKGCKIRTKHPGYVPSPPDQKIATESKEYLDRKFRIGIKETIKHQSPEQRIETVKDVIQEAARIMDVKVDKVDFYQPEGEMKRVCGYYDRTENSLNLNAYMITGDNLALVEEQIYTVFHELLHARQWAAVTGKKDYGYTPEKLLEWAINFQHYIPCTVDDELYRRQPLERDAFGFEAIIKGEFTIGDFKKHNS